MIPGPQHQVRAHYCDVGREKDLHGNWRWVLPYRDPCKCTKVRLGGMNIDTPERSFNPVYVNEPLVSDNIEKIRDHYGLQLQCKGKVFHLLKWFNQEQVLVYFGIVLFSDLLILAGQI